MQYPPPPLAHDTWAPFSLLLEQSPDVVVRFDPQGRYAYLNAAAGRAVSGDPQACLGRLPEEAPLFGEAGTVRLAAAVRRSLEEGLPDASFELAWHGAEGGSRWHACRLWCEPAGGLLLMARDITEHRLTEYTLQAREREFRTLAENSPDNIIRYGCDMRAIYCNREISGRVLTSPSLVLGRRPGEAAPPGTVGGAAYEAQLARTLASGEPGHVEVQVPDRAGRLRTHAVIISPEFNADGRICGAVAVGRDVQAHVDVRQALADKEREFRSLAENMDDNIVRWAPDGRFLYANPALIRLLGKPLAEIVGRNPIEVFPDGRYNDMMDRLLQVARSGETAEFEQHLALPQGVVIHQVRIVPERDETGRVRSVLGVGRDITASVRERQMIEQAARTDALTRLVNRQGLYDATPSMLAAAHRHGQQVGLMLLDLDQFKAINDGMGHTAGDALLCMVAQRLQQCIRAYDLLVRLGGDEFVVVVPDLAQAAQMAAVAAQVHEALTAPVMIEQREVRVSASVGIAVSPADGDTLEALLANADVAMYHAKRSGRGRTQFYREELSVALRKRLGLEEAMRGAQHGDGLQLLFQPVTSLADGTVVGAEALLRWQLPSGVVMPDVFIPIAEETGMIVPMGRWVLRNAVEAVVRWNQGRAVPLAVAVNVSTRQFVLDDVVQAVRESLAAAACPAEWLVIEITESLLIEDPAVVQRSLASLRALGVRVAIDDFGTGYSALGYLARFDVDVLKIDRGFVQGIEGGKRPAELVKAFLAMAAALGLQVIAEGIETEAQARFLRAHQCPMGQGWHFGRPMPAAAFEALLHGHRTPLRMS